VRGLSGGDASGSSLTIKVRVPGWLRRAGSIRVNDEPTRSIMPSTAGSFLSLQRAWTTGDIIDVHLPPSLWAAPLNDHHAWHNATVAFMFGPLVLAGVNLTSDLFVPASPSYRTDPSSFITRVPGAPLLFEAKGTLDGTPTTIRMRPLRDVADEQYVVYFMAAGTKPEQPPVVYCPHSVDDSVEHSIDDDEAQFDEHGHNHAEEARLISGGAPAAPAAPMAHALAKSVSAHGHPTLRSRGVEWSVDAKSGRVWARTSEHATP